MYSVLFLLLVKYSRFYILTNIFAFIVYLKNLIEPAGKFRPPTLVNDSNSDLRNKELDQIDSATNNSKQKEEEVSLFVGGKDEISSTISDTDSPSKSNNRNRCFTCRKKVGLTGMTVIFYVLLLYDH